MTPLGFSPDINALVTVILALTTRLCLIAAHDLMPREAAARAGWAPGLAGAESKAYI
jgi:hypothetical protein